MLKKFVFVICGVLAVTVVTIAAKSVFELKSTDILAEQTKTQDTGETVLNSNPVIAENPVVTGVSKTDDDEANTSEKEVESVFPDSSWTASDIPDISELSEEELGKLPDYRVSNIGGKVFVSDYHKDKYTTYELSDGSGLFIALDNEQDGGGLYFFSTDGVMKSIENRMSNESVFDPFDLALEDTLTFIDHAIVRGFYELNGEYFYLHGYAYSLITTGSISRLLIKDGKWHSEDYLNLLFIPLAYLLDGQDLYVAVGSGLMLIRNDTIINLAKDRYFWRGRVPNSIVKIDETLYIGAKGGVASYNLKTKEMTWFEKH